MKEKFYLVAIIILLNLFGLLYGIYCYYDELIYFFKKPYLLIFVPDCPLYVLLFIISFPLLLIGKRYNLLYFLTGSGILKYSIWTIFVLSFFSSYYPKPESYILIFLHILMFLEGFLFFGIKLKILYLPIIISWFLLNDFVDYSLGTAPTIPESNLILPVSILLSIFIPIFFFLLSKKFQPFKNLLKSITK